MNSDTDSFARGYFYSRLVIGATLLCLVVSYLVRPAALAQAAGTFQESVFASGLVTPTTMAFAPDGRLFVAEQRGTLRVISNQLLLTTPFVTLNVDSSGERGLLGVAFDPDFTTNHYVYVYYTVPSPLHNRISRFTANGDAAVAGSEKVLLDLEGLNASNHNGGAIHFGVDRKLYIGVGENGNSANAQSLATKLGKVLRINSDGTIPADNPFVGTAGAKPEIWAYGFRNPFSFAVDSQTGRIFINDVGESTWEEVDQLTKGANYGWPTCEGPQNTGVGSCSNTALTYPIYAYAHNSAGGAITGGTFYRGTQFPSSYLGTYFFGDYARNFIQNLSMSNQPASFATAQSPVDSEIGPDGALYYASLFGGQIYRIAYVASTNSPPVAVISANPSSGVAPLSVSFSGTGSNDPDNDALSYAWMFGDGGTGSGSTISHTYTASGSYVATLTVSDGRGGSNSKTATITVSTTPPPPPPPPPPGGTYLSDLTPTSSTNGWGPVEKDKSNGEQAAGDGHTLTLNGVTYAKGLGTNAPSDIRYALSNCSSFTSDIGVDDEVSSVGSVVFQVYLDSVLAYDSGLMGTTTTTKQVTVNTSGKSQLRLVVTDGGNGNSYDHADWAGARVTCGSGSGGTSYLSDLTPTSSTNGWGPVEKDKSNGEQAAGDGRTLTLNGVTYAKGLGTNAPSDIRYALGNCSSFVSDIGVDDEVSSVGSVVFQVYLDSVLAYDSGLMGTTTTTKQVTVNTSGKSQLRLVVTDGGNGNSYDHADWAGAQITCGSGSAVTSYLSDLTPTSSTNGWGPVEKDKSNGEQAAGDGRTLTLNGVTYAKGLGTNAPSDIRYTLGNCSSFVSDIGVDDEVSSVGSVAFQVYLDGVLAYDSGLMGTTTTTKQITVNTSGKSQLRLVVTDGGNGNSYDHADWAGARITCTSP